jgi:hypothetical protein
MAGASLPLTVVKLVQKVEVEVLAEEHPEFVRGQVCTIAVAYLPPQ